MCKHVHECTCLQACTYMHARAHARKPARASIRKHTQACRSKTHWTGTAPRVGTHGWVSEARSVILPKSGGSAAVLHRRLGLFLNPLAPSDSHAACSPLLPGKFYATKIDVLEGMGCAARPRRRKAACPLPADTNPGQDDGLGDDVGADPLPPREAGPWILIPFLRGLRAWHPLGARGAAARQRTTASELSFPWCSCGQSQAAAATQRWSRCPGLKRQRSPAWTRRESFCSTNTPEVVHAAERCFPKPREVFSPRIHEGSPSLPNPSWGGGGIPLPQIWLNFPAPGWLGFTSFFFSPL